MILKILGCGTSTGVPIPGCQCIVCTSKNPKNNRLRTSALIKVDSKTNILIDATTDLRQQALKWDITHIEAVLFTHAHADHILGIDDLRGFNFVQKASIPCYGSQITLQEIRKTFNYVFNPDPRYEGGAVPKLDIHEINESVSFICHGISIQPFTLMHGKLPITGFRCGEMAYATDCKTIPDESYQILKGVKYLILDGLRYEDHKSHLTIPEAIQVAQNIKAQKTYLTHMTHNVDYEEVNPILPTGIELAYDGLEIEFE